MKPYQLIVLVSFLGLALPTPSFAQSKNPELRNTTSVIDRVVNSDTIYADEITSDSLKDLETQTYDGRTGCIVTEFSTASGREAILVSPACWRFVKSNRPDNSAPL